MKTTTRRVFAKTLAFGAISSLSLPILAQGDRAGEPVKKAIPSSGELLSVIGMGTWQTFNVGRDQRLRDDRTEVLKTFFAMGGQMIDSSPMYGSSQDVVGYALTRLAYPESLFSAEKIWTRDGDATQSQAQRNYDKWGVNRFDLLQIHNLLGWEAHLEHLLEMQQRDELRYIGVTTSHGRRHSELQKIMQTEKLDFVQLTYNLEDREAEQRLLPLAQERGIGVIVNRPFQGGRLVDRLQRRQVPLPAWAQNYNCNNWPQLLLKFVVSHPAVTCAIPATSQVEHMQENMGAMVGPLLTAKARQDLIAYVA